MGFKLGKTKGKSYTYQPKDRDELKKIIESRLEKDHNADLNDIDVSNIHTMYNLFLDCDPYNIDISKWDVSNVKDMDSMFWCCENLNCDLSEWDVSNVKNMLAMFTHCKSFEGKGLENWDVSNVKNMKNMFYGCDSLEKYPSWYNKK